MDDEAVRRLLAERSRGLVNLQVSAADGHGVRASWNAAQAFPAICPRGQLVCLAHLSARETVHDLKKLLLYIVKIGLLLHHSRCRRTPPTHTMRSQSRRDAQARVEEEYRKARGTAVLTRLGDGGSVRPEDLQRPKTQLERCSASGRRAQVRNSPRGSSA